MRQAIQLIKKKRDNPISLAFSVNDGKFIITISFLTDTATFRLAVKTIGTAYYCRNVSEVASMVRTLDKDSGFKKD